MLELTINPYSNYERTVEYNDGLVYYTVVSDDEVVTFTDLDDIDWYISKNDLVRMFMHHNWGSHWAIDSYSRSAVEVDVEEYVYYCE